MACHAMGRLPIVFRFVSTDELDVAIASGVVHSDHVKG